MSKARDIARAGTALSSVDATELGYLDGVTSNVQTQINAKLATATAASTYQPLVSGVSDTEIGYLDGVTSAIQTQLNQKPEYVAGKNKVINGNMSIDQRTNGSSASISTSGGSYPGVDRWQMGVYTGVTATTQRVTDAPAGFGYSNKWTITTGATVPSNNGSGFWQWIEGLNVQDLGWFAAGAKTVTLSFWAKSSVTGNHSVNIHAGNPISSYCTTYNIASANTWEYKTIVVPGPTSGATHIVDNTGSVAVTFAPAAGSTYRTTANTWTSGYYQGVTGMVQLTETTGATWQITGVQLEIGSNATVFSRSTGTQQGELAACQRYYYRFGNASGSYSPFASAFAENTTSAAGTLLVPTMRTSPTLSYSALSDIGVYVGGATNRTATSINLYSASPTGGQLSVGISAGTPMTNLQGVNLEFMNTSGWLALSAEL